MRTNLRFILLILLSVSCSKVNSKSKASSQEEFISVRTSTITTESIDTSLTYSGSAMPWDQLILSFKSSGRIKKLTFEEGDIVKEGQFLGSLKEVDYWLQRKLASIQVKTLKPDYERVKRLTDQNALPGAERNRMEGRYRAAKTQLLQAESMLSGTYLRAPMSGIVVKKLVTVGDMVSPARPIGVILNLSQMKVVVVVPELELRHFRRGMAVTVHIEALGRDLPGTVHSISYMADEKTRGFPVTIMVTNIYRDKLPLIRAGMLASVRISRPPVRGIFLPFDTVMKELDGTHYVFINNSGRARKRVVTVGKIIQSKVRITSGLSTGDQVITEGHQYLRGGVAIQVKRQANPPTKTPPATRPAPNPSRPAVRLDPSPKKPAPAMVHSAAKPMTTGVPKPHARNPRSGSAKSAPPSTPAMKQIPASSSPPVLKKGAVKPPPMASKPVTKGK